MFRFGTSWFMQGAWIGFSLTILVAALLRYFLIRFAKRTGSELTERAVGTLSGPVNVFIIFIALWIGEQFLIFEPRVESKIQAATKVILIGLGIYLVDRMLILFYRHQQAKHTFLQTSSSLIQAVIHAVVFGLGALVILDSFGISITPILASLGVGSLAVALALQDTLANFFSGVYLSIERPLEVGHFIKLQTGEEGYVDKIGWRSARIRTFADNVVVVPNSKLAGNLFTNFSSPSKDLGVSVEVSVHYGSDLARVERITGEVGEEVMREVKGAIPGFAPFIRYHTFAESGVNFTVSLMAQGFQDQHLVKHEFIKRLHERFRRESIVIPYPTRTVELKGHLT